MDCWKNILKRGLILLLTAAMIGSNVDMTAFATGVNKTNVQEKISATAIEEDIEIKAELVDLGTTSLGAQPGISFFNTEDGTVDLKPGHYEKWIDRIDVPKDAVDLYNTLVEYSDNDGIDDFLISNAGFSAERAETIEYSNGDADTLNAIEFVTLISPTATEQAYVYKTMRAVFDAFLMDHPEVFWLSGSTYGYGVRSYDPQKDSITYTFYLPLKIHKGSSSQAFDMRADGYQNESAIRADIEVRDNAVNNILATEAVKNSANTYETIRALNEWLTKNNEYNTLVSSGSNNEGDRTHNCLSGLTGSYGENGPVCEGYAEAFKILCDKKNIPCVLVSGNAYSRPNSNPEPHAWNNVKIDGAWYAVDITWNDPVIYGISDATSGYENENYLLVGSDTVYKDMEFEESHVVTNCVSSNGISFINGPLLSSDKYVFTEDQEEHTKYAIRWDTDGDGKVNDTTFVTHGETPTHENGSRPADAQYTYTFTGWSPSIVPAVGDATYTAQFDTEEIPVEIPDENDKPTEVPDKNDKPAEIPDVKDEPAEQEEVIRIFGTTRYETSFGIADQFKEKLGADKFNTVIIASGTSFADALAGSYLASKTNAPILMTNGKNIKDVYDYISKNLASGGTIYLLGGTAAVPQSVEDALIGLGNVIRLAGANRYETNLEILKEAGVDNEDILVCTGKNFADSLSGSAAKKPILLVNKTLSEGQIAFLKEHSGNQLYIIGGVGAVSKALEAQLAVYGTTIRIGGSTRYETSILLAKEFFDEPKSAVLAYAKNFPDGLCGGSLAMIMDAPLILTANGKEAAAANYVQENDINSGAVLGGSGLISDEATKTIFGLDADSKIDQ